MSRVYFISTTENEGKSGVIRKLESLIKASGCFRFVSKKDIVAVKITFGERGNKYFIGPEYIKVFTNHLRKLGSRPFLTDANVLYKGERTNAVDHLDTARAHGFLRCGIPVIIADGLMSKNYKKVAVNQKHFKTVNIARDIADADFLVSVSHFKGHMQTGFGAALKNIGMGSASRSGKQQQHSHVKPEVDRGRCVFCGGCFEVCPVSAIVQKDKKAFIDRERCIGCAECVATCKFSAIAVTWEETDEVLQEKMAEYALGALKNKDKKSVFINFAINISKECDCWNMENYVIAGDVGVFASDDPVAVDKATVEAVIGKEGRDVFKKTHPNTDWRRQLEYGSRIGLGSLDYELTEVGL